MKLVCVDLYEVGFLVPGDKVCVKRNLFDKILYSQYHIESFFTYSGKRSHQILI